MNTKYLILKLLDAEIGRCDMACVTTRQDMKRIDFEDIATRWKKLGCLRSSIIRTVKNVYDVKSHGCKMTSTRHND